MKLRINPWFWLIMFVAGLTGHGLYVIATIISVLLHETAHAVAAWAFSYPTYRIDLFPFGGVAIMDSALGGDPVAEGYTALAGPLYSLFFAALTFYGGDWLGGGSFFKAMSNINLSLGLLNLLPLYPLDGGRVVRSMIGRFLGLREATRVMSLLTRWTAGIAFFPAVFLLSRDRISWTIPVILFFLFWAARDPKDYFYLQWRQRERRRRYLMDGKSLPVTVHIMNQETELREAGEAVDGKAYHILLTADDKGGVNGWLDEATLWESLLDGDYLKKIASVAKKLKS